jgi:TolA-binding protein
MTKMTPQGIGWILVLILAPGLAGDLQAAGKPETTEEDLKRESREAFDAARQYSAQQKEAFQQRMQRELDDLQPKIEELKRQAEAASDQVRIETKRQIRELEKERDKASRKLTELQAAGEEAWGELKTGMNAALKELQQSYDRAKSRLR